MDSHRQKYINFWGFYIFLTIILTILGLSYRLRNPKTPNQEIVLYPTTTLAPVKINVASPTPPTQTTLITPKEGKSTGIFYPFNGGVTINNNLPTIIGKVVQNPKVGEIYLDTKFGLEKSPESFEDMYYLRFLPGKVKNLKVKIDGIQVDAVYGISQYPTVLCMTVNINSDGTSSYDSKTGQKTPPDDYFYSEKDCLLGKSSEIPPLIFFTRVKTPLTDGKHSLSVEGVASSAVMTFFVNQNYHLPPQNIYTSSEISDYESPLLQSDYCLPGYYYDKNSLKFPLPVFPNPNLLYSLSIPQTKTEQGNSYPRRVQISFTDQRFDLFFPQSQKYFEGKSLYERSTNNRLSPYHEIYLPMDQLVFSNGEQAKFSNYLEIFPLDLTGGQYPGYSIPWEAITHSGCDG